MVKLDSMAVLYLLCEARETERIGMDKLNEHVNHVMKADAQIQEEFRKK